jgi:hypothetical protein
MGELMSNEAGTVGYSTYTVRLLRVAHHDTKDPAAKPDFEEIVYLADATMTDMQVMRHIFEKWGPA